MSRTRTVNTIYSTAGDFTFTVPSDCYLLTFVQGIGGGCGGNAEQTVSFDGKSGGGGMFAQEVNVVVTPGQTINGHVGAGGTGSGPGQPQNHGGDTWFGNSDHTNPACIIYAQGGLDAGSPQTISKGSTVHNGGAGVLESFEFGPGAGGGGAGGPNGVGADGTAPGSPVPVGTIIGGQGGGGSGGAGGQFQIPPNPTLQKGVAGTEMNGGVGSGGGGGTAVNNDVTGGPGGDGGLYGGGGGTGETVGNFNGGSGAVGVIVITYLQNIQLTQGQVF